MSLPARSIPRMERRVLGSVYGSARPERDFPALLALYRRGRLPLDRLISARLPLDAVGDAFGLMRGGSPGRVVLELDGSGGMSAARRPAAGPRQAVEARIAGVEVRRYAVDLDPPFRAAWDPTPRATVEATLVIVRSEDGVAGYASGDDVPDAALLEPPACRRSTRCRTEAVREVFETVDFHGGRPWTVEVAIWDLVGRLVGQPLWRLLGGRSERLLAYASTAEPVAGEERARRVAALRDRGVRAVKLRFHHDDWRRDVEVVEQVRDAVGGDVEIMVDANQGWRMAGDRSARWDVATATQCARALEPLGVYWLEEPLRTDDVEGYAAAAARAPSLRIAAGEMVRSLFEARDLILRGGVDVVQPDVVLAGGLGGCRRIAALADLCGRAFSPHTWTNGFGLVANLHLAAAVSTLPVPRGAARPARLDARPPRLAARRADRRDRRRRHDRAAARSRPRHRARPGRASRRTASPDGDPRRRPPRGARPAARRDAHARPAARGRGARPRRRGGRLPLGRPPRRRRPRRRPLADRARPRGRGRGRGRRPGGGGARGRATRSRSASSRRAGPAPRAAPGRFNLCEVAGAHAWAGTMLDGTTRLHLADGRDVRHFNFVSCFAEHCVVPAASAVPIPPGLPLWQAALLGCAVVTGFGAVRNAARVAIGESVCVVGCGGIGQQIVAAARMAGAGQIVAVDRDPAKLDLARGRGATDTVDASAEDAVAAVLALVPGGVDHALEAVGSPATIRVAWDVIRPGATAVVVGIAPRGAEARVPALELLSEKALRGSYYGSGNAAVEIARLGRLMADGRLEVADTVSHLTGLDGIEAAFERLRRGSGARTVAVLDPAIAGAPDVAPAAAMVAV